MSNFINALHIHLKDAQSFILYKSLHHNFSK